jgi:hypothetical protein
MTDNPEEPIKKRRGRPPGSTNKNASATKNPVTFRERMAEYERTMPKLTLNDRSLLQAMVNMEIQFPDFQKKIAGSKDGREAAKYQEAYNISLKEYRQIQSALGMDRAQRSTDIDMQTEIDKLVAEATELVENVGRNIACAHCVSDFEMGTLIFHFRDDVPWTFNFVCPKCGQPNAISGIKALPASMMLIEGQVSG